MFIKFDALIFEIYEREIVMKRRLIFFKRIKKYITNREMLDVKQGLFQMISLIKVLKLLE